MSKLLPSYKEGAGGRECVNEEESFWQFITEANCRVSQGLPDIALSPYFNFKDIGVGWGQKSTQ